MKKPGTGFLLTTAFFEGGAVMATEVLGARFLASYYGNSLLVWAGALGITLTGLAAGYFSGSYFSKRAKHLNILFIALFIGAVAVAAMPFITEHAVASTLLLDTRTGILLSCLLLLLVPLFCFGMASPLIIRSTSLAESNAGRITGNVYAISTAGGIVFTILMGFILIPLAGLMRSAWLVAALTAIFPVVYFVIGLSRKQTISSQ